MNSSLIKLLVPKNAAKENLGLNPDGLWIGYSETLLYQMLACLNNSPQVVETSGS